MGITKSQINREIKSQGGVMKRSKAELVSMIQRNADVLGKESIGTNAWLLWTLGLDYEEAQKVSSRLINDT